MSSLGIGVIGLGRVSNKILQAFGHVPGVHLAGAADLRASAREIFEQKFGLPTYPTAEKLCAAREVDVVWVATPNTAHRDNVIAACRAGKHVICEKPMAVTAADCEEMIRAADSSGVQILMVSKVLEGPVRAMRDIVESGRLGRVFQINTLVYTDWLQRPRLPDELKTELAGGILFRQGPHAIDIQRYIVGKSMTSVRAVTGRMDSNFASEGHVSAMFLFDGGAVGNATINGYGYFDGAELTGGVSESGRVYTQDQLRRRKPRRTSPMSEMEKFRALAVDRTEASSSSVARAQPTYGLTLVSCERGLIRQSPGGLVIYEGDRVEEIMLPDESPCVAELKEMRDALSSGRRTVPDGRWGRDTLEIALAMQRSSREDREMLLTTPQIAATN
jgi:phthalate 4,5-cis-dihydrodiol dehydrogenase